MNGFSHRERNPAIERLKSEGLDILIIGGGVTGAGLALEAVTRGLRAGLVEKRDFSSGTSSRSTKLIHGGLRYLEHFELGLVREGLEERSILTRTAPHLVDPFPFMIPIYVDRKRNYDMPIMVRAGLWLYDLLARRGRDGYRKHRRLTSEQTLELAPQLDPRGLEGAFVYFDAITNDARLVIEILKSAWTVGALAVNYTKATSILRDSNQKVVGARLRDELSGIEFDVRSSIVITATGVWTDELRSVERDGVINAKRVRPSKGIHLIVSKDRLRVETACLIPAIQEHRFYFVVPWEGRVLIGTTDTEYQGDWDAPRAEPREVAEILRAINAFFTGANLAESDIISTFAGLRPLVGDGTSATKDVSRKEEIIEATDGLISLAGGKLTTYRRMAERAIDIAARRLPRTGGGGHSRSSLIAVGGGGLDRQELEPAAYDIVRIEKLPIETARHLTHSYGTDYKRVLEISHENERLREILVTDLPHIAAEVVYVVRYEMAMTLQDVLMRRLRLALLAGRDVLNSVDLVAEIMAHEIGWSADETGRKIEAFKNELEREYGVRDQGSGIRG
jgi:glycerol-3-phosphate dehydrogenase